MSLLSNEEKQKISAAIEQAEKQTSGEFVAVIATASDDYFYIPTLWAALLALCVPSFFDVLSIPMDHMILTQFVVFIVAAVVCRWQPLKMRLIPTEVKQRRARRHAHEQFLLQGLHHTAQRNGVMLFVSEAEHYVQIIADKGVNDVVASGVWDKLVAEFITHVKAGEIAEGFLQAVAQVDEILKEHFPANKTDENELSNHLIEVGVPY